MEARLYISVITIAICIAVSVRPAEGVTKAASPEHFETAIAPLLAQRCLECHDATTKKGKLDLSRRDTAFAGAKHGKAIVPGKPSESLMWKSVESREMPDERPPPLGGGEAAVA